MTVEAKMGRSCPLAVAILLAAIAAPACLAAERDKPSPPTLLDPTSAEAESAPPEMLQPVEDRPKKLTSDGVHPETGVPDACYDAPDLHEWPEVTRAWLFTFSCRTVRWADNLFGDEEEFREEEFGGLLITGIEYDEYDGFDAKLRFRLRADLPNVSKRFDAFFGRVDEDVEIADQRRQESRPLAAERGENDPAWLLGLGYRRPEGQDRGWDFDVGVRLRVPPRPYVRTRYQIVHRFDEDTNLRFRQTFFWRQDRGLGTTSHFDFGQQLGGKDHVRWESVATFSEESIGVDYFSGITWYRQIDGPTGVALLTFVRGETDAPVPVYEYGFELTWRQPFLRDWMFISFGPTVTWPRELIEEKRELSLGFAVATEMTFGAWRR